MEHHLEKTNRKWTQISAIVVKQEEGRALNS